MDIAILTEASNSTAQPVGLAQLRLMQLVSPALPIGGFMYSQGLEYAVEAGWVADVASLEDWLLGLLHDNMAYLEVPVLARLYQACAKQDIAALETWGRYCLASRETAELRTEEQQRARALTRLLIDLNVEGAQAHQSSLAYCQASAYVLAAQAWGIPVGEAALGYVWSWLENQVAAAIKLVPLGQTDGQRVQLKLAEVISEVVEKGLSLKDEEIGASVPAMVIASSLHETQYTRLFRS